MSKSILQVLLALCFSSAALAVEPAYFQLKKARVTNVTEQYSSYYAGQVPQLNNCAGTTSTGRSVFNIATPNVSPAPKQNTGTTQGSPDDASDIDPLKSIEVIVDQIINIGKKIWTIVDAGKPVVNTQFDTANALPRGVTCWADMSGWSMPQSQVYKVSYENGFGSEVVTLTYRVLFTPKGNVNGVGQYIANATILPAQINVSWGFALDASANVPSVFNQGTRTEPLAGMQMDMKWKVTTAFSHVEESQSYFISGDNKLVQLQ